MTERRYGNLSHNPRAAYRVGKPKGEWYIEAPEAESAPAPKRPSIGIPEFEALKRLRYTLILKVDCALERLDVDASRCFFDPAADGACPSAAMSKYLLDPLLRWWPRGILT